MQSPRDTVEPLWLQTLGTTFNAEEFVRDVMLDCGHDASGLSEADFLEMLNAGTCRNMEDMAWCSNEVLAFYAADPLDAASFVRAIFVALCAVFTIRAGVGRWDFVFDKVLLLLVANADKVDYDWRIGFLRQVLCGNAETETPDKE